MSAEVEALGWVWDDTTPIGHNLAVAWAASDAPGPARRDPTPHPPDQPDQPGQPGDPAVDTLELGLDPEEVL